MSQTAITLAFEQWKAQQGATGEVVLLDEFIFANVPDLDPAQPIDRNEKLPPAGQIVHRQAVSRKGVVNENAVVHSVVLGADVGDFSFNWIGLINKATGTLAMIVHAPEQQKLKTSGGQQGNVLTRSFLMEYNGAQTETGINTPAETWQIDFTARMAGMDERQRAENIDIYGAAAFLGDGWLVGKTGNQYFVTKGAGYVAGLRAVTAANQNITVTTKPVKVWLDVCWTGALTSVWAVQGKVTVAASLADYEQNGVKHYVFALASIDANGNITDLRPKGGLSDQSLKEHEKSRNHPDGTLKDKGFVQLSSATDSESESLAATPKAVKEANDNANERVPSTRKVNKKALSSDITLSADDVGAMPLAIRGTIDDGKTMASANLTGWWTVNVKNTSTVSDFPKTPDGTPLYGYGYLFVDKAGNTWIQHYYSHRGVNAKRQSWSESSPTPDVLWVVDYTTTYKPTAADVGALPLAGGKMLGDITLKNGGIIFPEEAYQNKAVGRCGTYATTALSYRWELYAYSRTNNDLRTNIITADVVDISKGNVSGGDRNNTTTTITLHGEIITPFKFTPGNYGNFDARYQAKGSYTPAGQAYTKAESDTRYNLKNTASKAANGWEKDASTGVITQWGSGTYSKNARITFPIAFPNSCSVVVGADVGSGIVGTALGARDKTGFTMYANSSTVSINWIARGY